MKISVIITAYNQPKMLNLGLNAFCNQKLSNNMSADDIEIIIADDGSTIETKELIENYQKIMPFKLIHVWHEDIGFRRSMILNKAVAKSSGDYLLFLDGDCIVFDDYLRQSYKLAEKGFFVAGNRVLLAEKFTHKLLSNSVHYAEQVNNWGLFGWIIAIFSKKVNKILPWLRFADRAWRKYSKADWKSPKGCNFGVWKLDFIAVNGFDEDFTGWGYEDSDLFIRLVHNGVFVKSGKFAVPVLHMWHKESDRSNAKENFKRMLERSNDINITQAVLGVRQYIKND